MPGRLLLCAAILPLFFAGLPASLFAGGVKEDAAAAQSESAEPAIAEPPPVAPPRVWAFTDIAEGIWRLAAVRIGYGSLSLNRDAMRNAGLDETYILQFKEEGVNGKAVFNFYFAPYAGRQNQEITLRQIVSTRMNSVSAANVCGLGEEEYYWYLQRITRWAVVNDRLELYAGTGSEEIILYYIK